MENQEELVEVVSQVTEVFALQENQEELVNLEAGGKKEELEVLNFKYQVVVNQD